MTLLQHKCEYSGIMFEHGSDVNWLLQRSGCHGALSDPMTSERMSLIPCCCLAELHSELMRSRLHQCQRQ